MLYPSELRGLAPVYQLGGHLTGLFQQRQQIGFDLVFVCRAHPMAAPDAP
jgi:hypothetical protein